jgi:hypothetical protein
MPGPAIKTELWYDKHTRSWVVQAMDAEDNQIGKAIYVYSKREAIAEEEIMKLEIAKESE